MPSLVLPLFSVLAVISYDPLVRIHLGPLSISPHGIGIAIGFLIGARFMLPESRKRGIPDEEVYPLFTRAAIGAIIGARVAYVINHFSEYDSVLDILKVWEGGISLLGGITGAVLLAVPRMKKRKLSFWKIMDAAAPGVALGIVVGRIGDLIIADHLGKTTDFFLGYRCPPAGVEVGSPCVPGTIVHQTALYDQILAFVLLLVLLRLRKKVRPSEALRRLPGHGVRGLVRLQPHRRGLPAGGPAPPRPHRQPVVGPHHALPQPVRPPRPAAHTQVGPLGRRPAATTFIGRSRAQSGSGSIAAYPERRRA